MTNLLFNIGDQFQCYHTDLGVLTWDIIGIDHDTPTDTNIKHSITLQTHYELPGLSSVFDNEENTNPDSNRKLHGRNIWKDSNIRQWLNSSKNTPWFSPVDSNDEASTKSLIDPELKAVIGPVNKESLSNYNSDYLLTTSDTVFCLSLNEVGGGLGNVAEYEGRCYEYYLDPSTLTGNNPTRIKYREGTPQYWWLRTPDGSSSAKNFYVNTHGACATIYSNNTNSIAPALCIV